jgi:hypothetical protein
MRGDGAKAAIGSDEAGSAWKSVASSLQIVVLGAGGGGIGQAAGGGGGGALGGGGGVWVRVPSSEATSAMAFSNVRSISARSSPIDPGGSRCPREHRPPTTSTSVEQVGQYRIVPISAQ